MNHLEAGRSFAHLAEAADTYARLELRLLLPREMKEAQRDLAAAVTYSDEQVPPPAIDGLGEQNFTGYQATRSDFECTELDELRSIFITKWQQEQQVFDAIKVKALELYRERGTDAAQGGERRG
jgi:hypothetical protein